MDLVRMLRSSKGIARTSTLIEGGASRTDLAKALAAGSVQRPERGWIALSSADTELIGATQRSAILTCVTQARRLGLWVLEEPETHVAARTPGARTRAPGCEVHWARPVLPRAPWILEDPLENVLGYVAACQPYETARAIWESALNQQLISMDRLRALPYRGPARHLREECTPFSDSGLETLVLTRLKWLRVRIVPQAWLHGHRVDFLIGKRLVLQIDGGQHIGSQRLSDNRHDSLLGRNGYSVIRVGYQQVVQDWPAVQHEVMTAIAQGQHLARAG